MRLLLCVLLAAGLVACSDDTKSSGDSSDLASVSQDCLESLTPVERYMSDRTDPLDDRARDDLRALLEKPYDRCSRKEFAIYRDNVLVPWAESLEQ